MKKYIFLAIVIAIASGLVITSTAISIPIIKTTPENFEINAQCLSVQSKPLPKKTCEINTQHLSFAGTQVTFGDFDEYHGSVAGAPNGEYYYYALVEYTEDDSIWHPVLFRSIDSSVWESQVEFLYDNSEYTDFDQNAYGTYATFGAPPNSDGIIPVIQGEIGDGSVWDFSPNNIYGFLNNRIDCYTFEGPDGDPGNWNWGGLAFVGYNGFQGLDIEGCPFIFYQYSDAGGGIIGWVTGDTEGCEHVGSAMDLVTNMHYAVYDRNTGENYELLVRKDDFGSWTYNSQQDFWTHNYKYSKHITDTVDLMYPCCAAYNDHVIIGCQKDDDIVVYYSSNGMSSYSETLVEEAAYYPEVAIAAGGITIITYIKDNVLYYRTSENYGISWSDAEVVSDSQINLNNRAANLDEYKGSIIGVWEDTRGDNIDIYYDLILEAQNDQPQAPDITGPSEGVPETFYDYVFSAVDPNDDKVRIAINWGDGKSDLTGLIDSGEAIILNHTWSERGEYIITASAQDFWGEQGPEASFTVTIPRNKGAANIFILQLLNRFPNVFPIIQKLLKFGLN